MLNLPKELIIYISKYTNIDNSKDENSNVEFICNM